MVPILATSQTGAASQPPASRAPFYSFEDHGDALSLLIELPGADSKEIDLEISVSELSVRAGLITLAEGSFGAYAGALQLPAEVEPEQTSARYGEGILVVTIPKSSALTMHKVKIDVDKSDVRPHSRDRRAK
jgi:HSP20 family molecular chaperone IbpA